MPLAARVLVTDGEQRSTLAVVRSLGHAGHHPLVTAAQSPSLAGVSRYAAAQATVPNPLSDPAGHVAAIRRLVQEWKAEFVIPMTEAAMLALLPARESLGAVIPCATAEAFRRVSDKAELLEAARSVGIAVPEQRVIAGSDAGAWAGLGEMGFPLVLKPARSVGGGSEGQAKFSVRHASNTTELEQARAAFPRSAYPILAQRRIIGPGVGIFLLLWEGEVQALFAHRRIREKPPSGGVSVYRESYLAEPGLVARSRSLLDQFGWQGVAMIEYKIEEATGTPYLMEINGRFWGSLQLAVDAGVDFPALLIADARGERPAPVTNYRPGVRSRWWWGDVDHLLARLLKPDASLSLPPGTAGRWRALASFLVLWRPGDRSEICRWDDLAPGWHETRTWFRSL